MYFKYLKMCEYAISYVGKYIHKYWENSLHNVLLKLQIKLKDAASFVIKCMHISETTNVRSLLVSGSECKIPRNVTSGASVINIVFIINSSPDSKCSHLGLKFMHIKILSQSTRNIVKLEAILLTHKVLDLQYKLKQPPTSSQNIFLKALCGGRKQKNPNQIWTNQINWMESDEDGRKE